MWDVHNMIEDRAEQNIAQPDVQRCGCGFAVRLKLSVFLSTSVNLMLIEVKRVTTVT
jgi:hypothetical protein